MSFHEQQYILITEIYAKQIITYECPCVHFTLAIQKEFSRFNIATMGGNVQWSQIVLCKKKRNLGNHSHNFHFSSGTTNNESLDQFIHRCSVRNKSRWSTEAGIGRFILKPDPLYWKTDKQTAVVDGVWKWSGKKEEKCSQSDTRAYINVKNYNYKGEETPTIINHLNQTNKQKCICNKSP